MFLQHYLLCRELIFFVLLCAINIYAPNGMEEISKEEASSALSESSTQKASAVVNTESVTILEPKQSEHYESVDQEQAVTVKEVSTSELQDLVITPTVAPATPHYDTDISHSSSIIKSVIQNDAPEQNNTHNTVKEPKKNQSESNDRKDDTRPNQGNVASKTTVVQDEVEKADENHTNNVVTEDIAVRLDSPPSEDTDSITATLKQAEEETSAKEEEMPSFDEFKKKLLEEEKSKIKQQQQQDPLTPHQPPVKPKSKKIKERKKSNYAAIDCGAKILSSNPEASNALSILVENRDLYMLNPCSKQIWFIVELCELVQVKTIEIANFELFSSTPESFRVYVSSRFPTRDWTMLGTFQARDERDIQSFPLDEPIYAKYLKVEMVSHFGSQHYCPLSLFRVFGVSMVEEYEDHESGSTENNEDEEVIPVLPPDPGVSSEKEEKKPNILEEAANKVFNFVKEAAIKITQVVHNSNETTGKNPEESVGNKAMDENKQKIVTLIGKDEPEDSSTIEHGNQTLNESTRQTIKPKSSDHIKNHSRGNGLGEVSNEIKLKSNMKCTFGTMRERFLRSLGDSSNCSCTLGKILCFKSNKLRSSRNSEEIKINLKNLSSTSVVSKSDTVNKPKQTIETILQDKSKLMDEESSSMSSDCENRSSASSVTSSLESNKESITESSTIVQNQEVKSIDSEQKAAVNQTADKIQITTFIQPSKAKETLSRHFVITPKGSETPHLPLAATVTVKPGNSTVITDKPSLEIKETVVTEKDPEDKSHSSAAMTGKQGNNEGLTSRQKGIKQSNQQSHVKSEIPNETDTKIKNVVTQIDSISSDASEQPKSTIDLKEPGCDVQIDALASQSSSVSQCSAVNSIEMMNHPVPGVDVLEIKLADGTKEATAHPQHPDSGTPEKQKDPSVDDKQDLPSNAYLKDEGFKEGNATATMQKVPAEKNKDAESTSADDTDLKLTESLSSEASVVNKPISNLEESIPPIPVPPVVQQDTQSTTTSAKPSSTKSNSATITTPNEEHSVPDTSGGAGTTETMLAIDASLETNYPSSIDKMVAQVGSTSVPNIGSSTTQKESIFLRLSNKIKALEQNLTLSTRYMEQLNQRYRKSLEEIQKKFDKRINVLTNATKLAEALIKSQKEQITKLQEKQKEMNNIVERMAEKMHRLNQEVMERHIVGLFLEIVLIIVVLTILRRRDRAAIVSLVRSARNNMVINGHGPPRPAAIARYESKDVNDKDAFSTGVGGRARHTTAALSRMLENVGSAHSGAENSVDKVEETHDIILEASKKKKSRRKMKSSSVASGALSDSTTTGIKPLRKAPSNQASLISKTAGLLFSPIGFLNGLYSKKTAISSNSDPCISGVTQVSVRRNSASLMEADSLNPILAKTKSLELVPEDECNVFAPLCKTSKIPCAPPPPPTKRFKVTTNVPKKSPNSVFHSSSSKFRGKTRGAGNASVVTG